MLLVEYSKDIIFVLNRYWAKQRHYELRAFLSLWNKYYGIKKNGFHTKHFLALKVVAKELYKSFQNIVSIFI